MSDNREIRLLSKETIEQIAAGEVIENPACVVKELIENAIDASAKQIQLEINNGGIDSIRISDDGTGIPADQVECAFLPHSTSKLRDIKDLYSIRTMGFRGEALSSIAAVSRVTMTTKTRDALSGVCIRYEGAKKIAEEETGAADGTTILVDDLFFNTPARRKFLRTPQTEGSYVTSTVEHLALCNPRISFELTVNGRLRLHTSGNGSVRDVVYQIYGKEVASNLIEVQAATPHMQISGVIGKPVITRSGRALENYFINQRYIRSNIINKAIDDGYRPFMMVHQYPFTCLYIGIDSAYTDVNVHPRKMELKFVESNQIYGELFNVIKEALADKDMIPREEDTDPDARAGEQASLSEASRMPSTYAPFERRKLAAVMKELDENSPYHRIYDDIREAARVQALRREERAEEMETGAEMTQNLQDAPAVQGLPAQLTLSETITKEAGYGLDFKEEVAKSNFTLIGQLFDTYWLVEMEGQLFIIDQHAAHEKILFEENMKRFRERSFYSQQVSPAFILSLSGQEQDTLEAHRAYFAELGFEIEEFGEKEYAISAVPDNLYGISYEVFLRECLELMQAEREKSTEVMWHRIATASCKAAIKGNMKKSAAEAEQLIRRLMTLEDPYHCPHGRPTIITMSKSDIEKRFKRIV